MSTFAPVINACYPLQRIADAHRHAGAGHEKGNVVVTMTDHPPASDPARRFEVEGHSLASPPWQ